MNGQRSRFAFVRDRWFAASVGGTFAVFVFSFVVGFIWLPSAQSDNLFKGLWNAMCGAAGVPKGWLIPAAPPVTSTQPTSAVVLTPDLDLRAAYGAVGRGGTLALKCTMCHGTRGVTSAEIPSLAGEQASSVYKQLKDFQSGARTSAVMRPLVLDLSDQDFRDLAAFYASLPRAPAQDLGSAPDIVAVGAPMRNIAPCGSCHGAMTSKIGAPWLDGQSVVYLQTQLAAFAHAQRRNDINGQMRNVAKNLTDKEMHDAAEYYAGKAR
ncbi:cytochrome c553 [Luteibacter sp. 621]|uniref:c-type cytochrome n=1 Tax=Luteibacter sp. 621 TaxID=3373916 RepID=UPI003D1EC11D